MKTSYFSVIPSPVGPLTLRWSGEALVGAYFEGATAIEKQGDWIRDDAALAPARAQLEEYFRGERTAFDLPLAFEGSLFQQDVWRALVDIPFGETTSYGDVARRIGKQGWSAARAVGAAAGQNPIVIIVPCHRVIGADGSLTGFGGGLPRKQWLLRHEGIVDTRAPAGQMRLF